MLFLFHTKSYTRITASIAFILSSSVAIADNNLNNNIEKCINNLGTISVIETAGGYAHLSPYGLGSPAALLRLMIQQSGCFDVVERGTALSSLQQERALANSGELQNDSNVGKGQIQAADFILTPNIQISSNTGGMGAAAAGLGRMFGNVGATLGGIAAGVKFKEAQTSILITDVRSGIQVAAAEGTGKKTDFGIGGWSSWGGGGGYSTTPEGKMIAAGLLDNYNAIVLQIRDKPLLIKQKSNSSTVNAANSIQATNLTPTQHATPTSQSAHTINTPIQTTKANYAGSFNGGDQGTFAISISPSGQISGSGNSINTGRFLITGIADASGSLSMSTSGKAKGTSFSGFIDLTTGALKGVWSSSKASGNGAFIGSKM